MWSGQLNLGHISATELSKALPGFVSRLARIEVAADGSCSAEGEVLPGLRLVSGTHMMTGATYVAIIDAYDEQTVALLTIDEHSADRLCVVSTTAMTTSHSIDKRWELWNPAAPTKLVCTRVSGKASDEVLRVDVDLEHLLDQEPAPISVSISLKNRRVLLALRVSDPHTLNYEADVGRADRASTGGVLQRSTSRVNKVVTSGWIAAAAVVIRHLGRTTANDPMAMLWHVSIGSLAKTPSEQSCRTIDQALATLNQ